jgi:hypothetical protein
MKNIHILLTDKPSRLHEFGDIWFSHKEPTECFRNYNIYITSDEQAKEGDWGYIPFQGGNVKLVGKYFADDWKKIILTTDQDLIKDGVQAIDDEFLEWFVNNSSCESVEVNFIADNWGYYEIIIPKEETKQETLDKKYTEEDIREAIDMARQLSHVSK